MNPEKLSGTVIENKEQAHAEALAFNDEVTKETERVLHERGIDTLSPSDYENAKEDTEREIIREKLKANPALQEIHNEAVGKVQAAAEDMQKVLKESGASEEVIDNSRRKFMKYFGLGAAAVAASGFLPKGAEAGELTQKAAEVERSLLAFEAEIETNTETIGVLATLSEDEIGAINSGIIKQKNKEENRKWTKEENRKWTFATTGIGVGAVVGTSVGMDYAEKSGGGIRNTTHPLLGMVTGVLSGMELGEIAHDATSRQEKIPIDNITGYRLTQASKYFTKKFSHDGKMSRISMNDVKNEIIRLNDNNKELKLKIMKMRKAFRDL